MNSCCFLVRLLKSCSFATSTLVGSTTASTGSFTSTAGSTTSFLASAYFSIGTTLSSITSAIFTFTGSPSLYVTAWIDSPSASTWNASAPATPSGFTTVSSIAFRLSNSLFDSIAAFSAVANSSSYATLVASSTSFSPLATFNTFAIVWSIFSFSAFTSVIIAGVWYAPFVPFVFNLLSLLLANFVNPVNLAPVAPSLILSKFLLVFGFSNWSVNSFSYVVSPGLLGSGLPLFSMNPNSANSLFTSLSVLVPARYSLAVFSTFVSGSSIGSISSVPIMYLNLSFITVSESFNDCISRLFASVPEL